AAAASTAAVGTGAPSSLAAAASVGSPKSAGRKSDPTPKPEALSPANAFAQAMDAYSRGKLDLAQSRFESFIDENPRNENLPEAIFTLGRVYYDGRQFANASIQFLNIYEKYPRSPFAAESVYRLGLTLQKLEKTEQACLALSRVPLDYPKADKEILSKAAAALDRYKCR
ncbi:MAG: tetratricopeptide repeat protein, partial [Alphaproteobacteria bacterium]|nr:tetratricopeptide repeat protein [Alphaproteobacteria bacterium]